MNVISFSVFPLSLICDGATATSRNVTVSTVQTVVLANKGIKHTANCVCTGRGGD